MYCTFVINHPIRHIDMAMDIINQCTRNKLEHYKPQWASTRDLIYLYMRKF
jgi:hypothetical protein